VRDVGQHLLHEIEDDHRQREIDQGEVIATQPHEQRADGKRHGDPGGRADQNADIRVGAEVKQVERGGVGAHGQISRLPKRDESDAAEQVVAAHGVNRKNNDLVGERQR